MPRRSKRWIQNAGMKPGALHRQLGYAQDDPLPHGLLKEIYNTPVGNRVRGKTVTTKLKRRVIFAVNAQKRKRR